MVSIGFKPFCDRCQQRVGHSVGYPRPELEPIECGLCAPCWDDVHTNIFRFDPDPFGRDTYLGTQPF